MPETDYKGWISHSEASRGGFATMERRMAGFDYLPRISLALVVSDADEVWIKSSMDSVLDQVYPHLELCVCDNHSGRPHVQEALEGYAAVEERVKVRRLSEKKSMTETYNEVVSMAAGEFVALIDQGDELAPEALFEVIEFLQHVRADVVYTDEDHVDVVGERLDPVFKPYWSPDLLLSGPYVGRLCVMRKDLLDASGGFREGFEGAEEHDLLLRLHENTDRIHHLPGVLYHRRTLPERSGVAREDASSRAVEEALARRKVDAAVEPGLTEGSLRVVRRVAGGPRVSVIVSTPEWTTDVEVIGELEQKASYPIHQVILAATGQEIHSSADRVSHPFPARAANLAAGKAEGEYLLFVNGRSRIIRPAAPGWLPEILGHAQRQDVGLVGCKLLNPDRSLRHGGSLTNLSRLVGTVDEPVFEGGDQLPLVDQTFDFGVASAECMMVSKALFEDAGGFDDENLPMVLYDLDLSFRLREKGLLNVYTPHVALICGANAELPSEQEVAYVWERWWDRLTRMLYYQWPPPHAAHHTLDEEVLFMFS